MIESGLVVAGGEERADLGKVEGVEGVVFLAGDGGDAGSEFRLHGLDGEPCKENEGLWVVGKILKIGGQLAPFGGLVVRAMVSVEQVDTRAWTGRIVEVTEQGVATGLASVAEVAR